MRGGGHGRGVVEEPRMEVGGHDLGCGGVLDFAARGGEAGGTEWEEVGWGGSVGPAHKMHAW